MAKKDVDVRFNLIDNFTASFNKTIQIMTSGTKKHRMPGRVCQNLETASPVWELRCLLL